MRKLIVDIVGAACAAGMFVLFSFPLARNNHPVTALINTLLAVIVSGGLWYVIGRRHSEIVSEEKTTRDTVIVHGYLLSVVLRQDEDGAVVASCPAFPSAVSGGKDHEEALVNIREAIELCIESGDKSQ